VLVDPELHEQVDRRIKRIRVALHRAGEAEKARMVRDPIKTLHTFVEVQEPQKIPQNRMRDCPSEGGGRGMGLQFNNRLLWRARPIDAVLDLATLA
jgi:hypothetical protein